MNPLNYIRGVLVRETYSKDENNNHGLEIMFFLVTPDKKMLLTTNLALFQFLIINSNNIEDLLSKANIKFQKIYFEDINVIFYFLKMQKLKFL